jgi:NADH:ubiquinone oxidoreductase subunit H
VFARVKKIPQVYTQVLEQNRTYIKNTSIKEVADALKLLVKEIVLPQGSQVSLFLLAPAITLISALIG